MKQTIVLLLLLLISSSLLGQPSRDTDHRLVSTFSIVGRDSASGELGVAVASRFFAVGSVVPWAKADVGAVATQSFMNTSYGWRGLEMMEKGTSPEDVLQAFIKTDPDHNKRQVGIVAADGKSATYTGADCVPWAGGRSGPNYALQGNILTGEAVVIAMEEAFLKTTGTLADRLYAALVAGDSKGGDSRGRQSAAMLVVKKGAGYGGFTDRAIDIRVDDHPDPFKELGRLLNYAQMNYSWNEAWTAFTQKEFAKALPLMERTAALAPENPEVLYDLTVIRFAAGQRDRALEALEKAVTLNPKLKKQAVGDSDLKGLQGDPRFQMIAK